MPLCIMVKAVILSRLSPPVWQWYLRRVIHSRKKSSVTKLSSGRDSFNFCSTGVYCTVITCSQTSLQSWAGGFISKSHGFMGVAFNFHAIFFRNNFCTHFLSSRLASYARKRKPMNLAVHPIPPGYRPWDSTRVGGMGPRVPNHRSLLARWWSHHPSFETAEKRSKSWVSFDRTT